MKPIHLALTPAPTSAPPLSLYIHLPWCVRKCPYCDFNSHTAPVSPHSLLSPRRDERDEVSLHEFNVNGLPEQRYTDALIRDLEYALPHIWGRTVRSIFFGGGTPSLFSSAAIDRLLTAVRTLTLLDPFAEITLEANPGTVEAQRFAEYRAAGINRLSLGIQSFNNQHLSVLGRIHSSHEAHQAIDITARHFDNFNLDLMYALPEQSLQQVAEELRTALSYQPPHLSCYHLTLEPNTPFYLNPPSLPDDDTAADMQTMIELQLAEAGYEHYETSAFALPRRQARHNLNYWQFGDYLGIGAGAHSKLSSHERILRQHRVPQPRAYMEKVEAGAETGQHLLSEHIVDRTAVGFEFMMNALRLTQGFDTALYTERTGIPISLLARSLDQAEQRGLIQRDLQRIAPTPHGQRFLNDLLQLFLPEQPGVSS